MNRIDRIFEQLRQADGRALMPFLTVGDPDLATTAELLKAIQDAGASICELGFPFSDPIADGPVIQASMTHALACEIQVGEIFDQVARIRSELSMGLVAMVSYSIVYRIGPAAFVRDAAAAGFDGVIVPDLPLEESGALRAMLDEAQLTCSFLISPTTPIDRARRLAQACSGFVYLLARAGVTGERNEPPEQLTERIRRLRPATDLPIAVGFGVSTAEHVRQVVQVADAAIVGSAIMRRISEWRDEGPDQVVRHVGRFVKDLVGGLSPADAAV